MMTILTLIITGSLVGLMSSFFGLGGGVLIVPSLSILYPYLGAKSTISISLGVISLNTLLNIYLYRKIKLLPKKHETFLIFVGCLVGALTGGYFLNVIDQKSIRLIFVISLLLSIVKNLLYIPKESNQRTSNSELKLFVICLCGAALSSLTGLGGGIIFVPLLINILKLPSLKVPAFSNVAMFFACTIGLVPHLFVTNNSLGPISSTLGFGQLGRVDTIAVLIIFSGAIVSSKLGTQINTSLEAKTKSIFLNLALFLLTIKMILEI